VTQTTRMLLNRGTVVLTAVLILGMAAWIVIQVTGGGSSQDAVGMPAELWSIDADGDARVHPAVEVPADVLGMAAGPGGVWIVEPNGVVQLQPGKGTRRVIPLPGRPTTIEIDAHLGVWIGGLDRGGQGILWNIDPTTGRIVHSFTLPDRPESLAVAASGSPPAVWVISPAVATIHQIDATSGRIVGSNYFGGHISDISTDASLAWVAFDGDHSVLPVPSLALRSPLFHEGQTFAVPGSDALAVTEEMLWVLDAGGERVFPVDLATGKSGDTHLGGFPSHQRRTGWRVSLGGQRAISLSNRWNDSQPQHHRAPESSVVHRSDTRSGNDGLGPDSGDGMKPAGAQAMERIQHPERRVERRFPCLRPNLLSIGPQRSLCVDLANGPRATRAGALSGPRISAALRARNPVERR
jgi:hypothetical protein